jgi:hypothetical protein
MPAEAIYTEFKESAISTGGVVRTVAATKTLALIPVAQAFQRNCVELHFLMALPYVLARAAAVERARGAITMQSIVNASSGGAGADLDGLATAEEERLWALYRQNPDDKRNDQTWAWGMLRRLQALENGDAGFRALLHATTVLSWSAFECFAKDLWIAAMNARPDKLARAAVEAQERRGRDSNSPVSGKMVPFYVIEQYGFDLRSSIGSILSGKFDFTGFNGIKAAYYAAFGSQTPDFTSDVSQQLNELEAFRHVIVHNGGVADDEFVRRMSGRYAVGSRIEVNTDTACMRIGVVMRAGSHVLERVDACLTSSCP